MPEIEDSIKYIEENDRWLPLSDEFIQAIHNLNLTNWAELYLEPKKMRAISASSFLDLDSLKEKALDPPALRNEVLNALADEVEQSDFNPPTSGEIDTFRKNYAEASLEEQTKITTYVTRIYLSFLTYLFDCLSLMIHRKSICKLVEEAKNGNDQSLISAIQIDRSILFLPFVKERLIKAQFDTDPDFWRKLGYRISSPIFKGKISYHKLYLAFYVLDDLDLLDLPHSDILTFCQETGAFKKNQDGDDVGYLGKKLAQYKRLNNLHSK